MKKLKINISDKINVGEFKSQAGQDIFVCLVTKSKENGIFIDIGSAHPTIISNTYFLEKYLNWTGYLIEIDEELCDLTKKVRTSNLICSDATKVDYDKIFEEFNFIDYISLDIDGYNTLSVLKSLPINLENLGIMTFEHESYQIGDDIKSQSRKIMSDLGFYLLCSDVKNKNNSFEDWYINPNIYNINDLKVLESNNYEWSEILFE